MRRYPLRFQERPNSQLRLIPQEVALQAKCTSAPEPQEIARHTVIWPQIEADAEARPDQQVNPVDLGAILVPANWLLLAAGQSAVIDMAAISHAQDLPSGRIRAWFLGGKVVEASLPLASGQRAARQLRVPLTPTSDRSTLTVSLNDGKRELWKKEIHTMVVVRPPRWPRFGAVETKLRYDAPISVKDPKTGASSFLSYDVLEVGIPSAVVAEER